ncbi:LLM class flavin-dependent oxidoreductase [Pseudomonas typographi]|uniref:LLM class flavin-dependent oxidoreductase n=1 Tax=Pseudomonas typographi TaxID=2715964 RepID=A0ABR7Z7B6_9PSED|nr:LLM class flavin-dependent oxidoreductase [Pseudomonas typographi]MBD1551118.1 LLM class flavin-dependent oxidoreductase [Pseudomonas typographi]MBD1586388.1 LLM class flavin-dependent oxidoreductase [Pseudomonas typographi]MBD1601347.1 LLM class flavin-dependent oxidoreductase [Pseudomonas typographi]
MKFGIFSLMTLRDHPQGAAGVMADTREMVQAAEQANFDIAWFAEHHFCNYSSSPSPLMMASYAAGWTSKIKLGAGVLVLPLYNPLRVAQEIALLDVQSQGRAVIGLGTGYQAFEFERFGVDIHDKVEIFLEYWEVIEQALTQGVVEFQGKHIQVPRTTFSVSPIQKPLPPVYYTSTGPALLERFKNTDAVPFLAASTLGSPVLYKMIDGLNANWEKVSVAPKSKPLSIMQYVHVTDSRSEALEAGERARYVGRLAHHLRHNTLPMDGNFIRDQAVDGEQSIEQYAANIVCGSVEEVAAKMIDNIQRLDPSHFACNFQFGCMPLARARRSLERFTTEVLPLVERELGPLENIGKR